jgi:membrane-associated phospholipid phosphatase
MPFCWKCWSAVLVAIAGLCAGAFLRLDMPIARYFQSDAPHWGLLGTIFAGPVLVSLITVIVAPLLILRLVRGSLSDFAETVIVAGVAALVSFSVNDFVLKRIFGRTDVADSLAQPATAGFHLFGGDMNSSFPSGHAVMAAAGLVAFTRVYPRWRPLAVAALVLMVVLLLVGDWHFLSDIAAGLYLGALAGAVAGDLARSHFAQR